MLHKAISGRLNVWVDLGVDPLLTRGITRLRLHFGEASFYLEEVKAAAGEAAAFTFQLPTDYLGLERQLRIAFPRSFPYLPPEFSAAPSPKLDWPHVMDYGFCLYAGGERPITGSPEEVVDAAIRKVFSLIRIALPDADPVEREKEFAKEIRSYWLLQQPQAGHRLTLAKIPRGSTPLYVVSQRSDLQRQNVRYVAAENYEDISLLEQRFGRRALSKRNTARPGFFLRLHTTPPPRLPAADLLPWLAPHVDPDDRQAFSDWVVGGAKFASRWLVLALPVEGSALYTFHLRSKEVVRQRASVYGRRANRVSSVYAAPDRYQAEFTPIDVLDPLVVHQRGGSAAQTLANKRVVLIGAGSLGGEVSVLLARSGVGRLALVDNDLFEDVNIGRHVLGAESLGKRKVEALKHRITRDVPTVTVEAFPQLFQRMGARLEAELASADMVIITTADWGSEDLIWEMKSKEASWSLVHAWSEPHSLVGHALVAPPGASDARRLFEAENFRHRLSNWPNDGIEALPACGASFIPGGPIGLARIAGMVAQIAVDALLQPPQESSWHASAGQLDRLESLGGTYSGPSMAAGVNAIEQNLPWPSE
ncbi:MAG: ThiF family adenylyltransferase [Rhodanobacter sp.]